MASVAGTPYRAPEAAPVTAHLPLAERLLLILLYLAMLVSGIAFIEPSPHDAVMGLVAVACLAAGVRFDRMAGLLLLLLLLWNASGLVALMNALGNDKSVQYAITSLYLAAVATIFACVVARDTLSRLAAMRAGYVASAAIAAFAGILGYFQIGPFAEKFALYGRAMGPFKDPNVYAPYLIWPILIVMCRAMTERIRFGDLIVLGVLIPGFLLSFSRGAWAHLALSGLVMMALLMLTSPTPRARLRLTLFSAAGLLVLAAGVVALLSVDSVREMFLQRAQAVQDYDVGQGGRFQLQEMALSSLLDYPLGMGPHEFARIFGLQQHNVYLQAFVVYGWVGGFAYLFLIVATLLVGLRAALMRTPWQPYLIVSFATFVGLAGEGLIIDTDHWRHFFLLLGLIWGLSTASVRHQKGLPNATRAVVARG
ncbi:MAG: O-antigen ligase family protein [Pseudolabrys sp.]